MADIVACRRHRSPKRCVLQASQLTEALCHAARALANLCVDGDVTAAIQQKAAAEGAVTDSKSPWPGRFALAGGVAFALALHALAAPSEFIYFQF